jgi:two-component system response regulator FixJ
MLRYKTISLIDPDLRQRARCSKALANGRFHVEPYESIAEFGRAGNESTLILVHNLDDAVANLFADMRTRDYWAPALAYGVNLDPVRCSQLFLMGLVGYLPSDFKQVDLEAVIDGITEPLTGLIDLRNAAAKSRRRLKRLSKREAQILDQLQSGSNNREIGELLNISARTVEIHRSNMLRKLDATSAAAIRMTTEAKIFG